MIQAGRYLGWGIVIYAVMSLTWTMFVVWQFTDGVMPRVISLAVLLATVASATRALHQHTVRDAVPYALVWVAVVALLDALLSVPNSGWAIFYDWNLWVGYALVAAVPPALVAMRRARGGGAI